MSEQEILNGDPGENTGKGAEVSVLIMYGSNVHCSGTLVQRDWVVTSAHCLLTNNSYGGNDPGMLEVYHKGVPLGAKWVKSHPWYNAADKEHDIALIQVSYGAQGIPSNAGWTAYLPDWAPASAFNQQPLRCYGYGVSTNSASAGTLRTADLKVVSTTSDTLTFTKNSAGQNLAPGDSGGGCFLKYAPMGEPNDLPYLVGVNRATWDTGSRADYAPAYAEWISTTIYDKKSLDRRTAFYVKPCALRPWACMGLASTATAEESYPKQ